MKPKILPCPQRLDATEATESNFLLLLLIKYCIRRATFVRHKIWMDVIDNVNIRKTNLNLSTKIAFCIEISTKFKAKNSESGHLNFTKFQEKKIWMIQIKSEWKAGLHCMCRNHINNWISMNCTLPIKATQYVCGIRVNRSIV